MKRIGAICLTFLLSLSFLENAALAQEWQYLFNGKDLKGWVQRGGTAPFRAENGEIIGTTVVRTPNSFLCTEREFSNFILEAETKVDPRFNSGIQFRSLSKPEYENGRVHGYQFEIDENDGGFSGRIWDEARRRNWLDHLQDTAGTKAVYKPGEWNTMRIEAIGENIRTYLNGKMISEIRDTVTAKGFVALQVHGTRIPDMEARWRNIRIKEL